MFQPSNIRKKIMTYEKINEKPEKLPFAKNEVTRLMRKHLDDDKMIRDQLKVEMNKFLY